MIDNRKAIEKAKGVLMVKERLSEADAYRTMQKMAMDKRKSLRQVADEILKTRDKAAFSIKHLSDNFR